MSSVMFIIRERKKNGAGKAAFDIVSIKLYHHVKCAFSIDLNSNSLTATIKFGKKNH